MKDDAIRSIPVCAAVLLTGFPLWAAWFPLGPFGGSASIVVADPHSARTFLAAGRNGLLFRSRDAGESWTALPFPAQLHATLNALAIDPRTSGVYLAGLSSDTPQYSGILRTADGGATWLQVPDLRGEQVRAIAFMRANSQVVAAGTDSGVFASRDGGNTWVRISPLENSRLRPVVSVAFDSKDSNILYAGTPHLPWKTSDFGVSWHSIPIGMIDDSDVFAVHVDRNRPQRVFASACSGIYRSLTGGAAWTKLEEAKNTSYRTYVIDQDPRYENVWFAGTTGGVVRSLDGGASWEKVGSFFTRSIAFDPGRPGRILIATEDAGILRSDDSGHTWQPANNGFCNRRLSWLWTSAGAVYAAALDGPAGGSILQLAESMEWIQVAAAQSLASFPEAVLSPPWSPQVVLAKSESGLFVSEDGGRHWITIGFPDAARIRAFSALNHPWIAAVGPAGIFVSNEGRTWRPSFLAAEVFAVVATSGGRWMAATASGLKSSDDLGRSWRPVRGELESDTIQAICGYPQKTAWLFAAKYGVIYASVDAGRSWKRLPPPPAPVSSVKQLLVVPGTPDRLLVLTHQQGVWEWPMENAPF